VLEYSTPTVLFGFTVPTLCIANTES
jgi:hypothetical protein